MQLKPFSNKALSLFLSTILCHYITKNEAVLLGQPRFLIWIVVIILRWQE